ncbi:MAG: hypothetical protein HY958_13285 [Bacteroidia bacterium]|nr:hypothetical protein [Bacteroidia bacterium]
MKTKISRKSFKLKAKSRKLKAYHCIALSLKLYALCLFLTFNFLTLQTFNCSAQTGLPIRKLTIFKNSTCMVSKEGPLKTKDGKLQLPVPAQALFGTYWLGASKENNIKSIVFENDTVKKQAKAKNFSQVLLGNIGKQITITNYKNDKIPGKIIDFTRESNLLKMKLDNGKYSFMEAKDISSLEFADDNNPTFRSDSIIRLANIRTEKSTDNISLHEYYMQQGVNWIPSYFLRLVNDKEARLEMKATLENYAEDISEVETEVVVGAPQLYFGTRLDPMTFNYITPSVSTTTAYTGRWDNNAMRNDMSNMMQTQTTGGYVDSRTQGYFSMDYGTEGEKNNDLYYYNLGKITLPKNSKGNYPIFASTLGYKDKYEVSIPDKINYASYLYCDNTEGLYDVFHSIEIKNSTNFPFTTAPVMVITDKSQFLAQDLLKYTPTGAATTIKLSKAIDIILKNSEEEVSRVENIKKIAKTTYSKVLLKGTVIIENHQQKGVTIEVTKNMNGTVTNSNNGVLKKQKVYGSVNPSTEVKWEVTLGAGEKKTINYEYEVLFVPYNY